MSELAKVKLKFPQNAIFPGDFSLSPAAKKAVDKCFKPARLGILSTGEGKYSGLGDSVLVPLRRNIDKTGGLLSKAVISLSANMLPDIFQRRYLPLDREQWVVMRVSIATYVALQGLLWGDSGAWHFPALSSPKM